MKKIFSFLLILPLLFYGQSKEFNKKYKKQLKSPYYIFLTDANQAFYSSYIKKKRVPGIILNSKKHGYITQKVSDKDGYILNINDKVGTVFLIKSLDGKGSGNLLGTARKSIMFENLDINNGEIISIVNEIKLADWPYMPKSEILIYYNRLKNFIKDAYLENYNLVETSFQTNIKEASDQEYDMFEKLHLSPKNASGASKRGWVTWGQDIFLLFGETSSTVRLNNGRIVTTYYLYYRLGYDPGKLAQQQNSSNKKSLNSLRFTINGEDLRDINEYDLEKMVNFFLEDCKKNNIKVPDINSLKARFVPLEGSTLALAYGGGDDSIINIEVDPKKWAESSAQKRWYVIYHELGHDVLNLDHGQGGKMMFNFADRDYTWDEFFEDKKYMFNFVKNR